MSYVCVLFVDVVAANCNKYIILQTSMLQPLALATNMPTITRRTRQPFIWWIRRACRNHRINAGASVVCVTHVRDAGAMLAVVLTPMAMV